jgi:hypothetical protein
MKRAYMLKRGMQPLAFAFEQGTRSRTPLGRKLAHLWSVSKSGKKPLVKAASLADRQSANGCMQPA